MRRWILYLCLFSLSLLSSPAQAKEALFTLFQTGATHGLASNYYYEIQNPYPIFMAHLLKQGHEIKGFSVKETRVFFYQNGHYIWGEHLNIENFHEWLANGGLKEKPEFEGQIPLLDTPDALSFEPSQDHHFISQLQPLDKTQNNGVKAQLKQGTLRILKPGIFVLSPGKEGLSGLSPRPYFWELILGSHLHINGNHAPEPTRLILLGKAFGEGSRRARLISNLRQPKDLLLDSGNLLEGLSSVKTQQLSLQRVNSLKMARELNYFAIAVGKSELRGGLDNLLKEQKEYELPFISANLYRNNAPIFPPYKITKKGNTTLAVIGLSDPEQLKHLKERAWLPEDSEILAPDTALKNSVLALEKKLGKRPDILVLLSNLPPQELERLAHTSRDLHLIMANNEAPFRHIITSQEASQEEYPHPFLVKSNPHALNLTQLQLKDEKLSIRSEVLPIHFEMETEPGMLAALMETRHNAYRKAFDVLIPDLQQAILETPELKEIFLKSESIQRKYQNVRQTLPPSFHEHLDKIYPPILTKELLATIELNALLDLFQTEIAILQLNNKMELNIPGALPRMLVYELLRTDDSLEIYYLTGKQIKQLFEFKAAPLVLGGLSSDGKKIHNRPLDLRKIYKTLIPSSVSRIQEVQALLKNTRKDEKLFNPFSSSGQRERVYLRNTILSFLDTLSQKRDYVSQLARLMQPRWNSRQNLISFDLDDFQLNISGYNAINNQNYAAVRETRVTSPDSYTFGGKGKLTLGFDNEPLGFLNSVAAKFEGLSVVEASLEKFTENQDDLIFSSELQLHLLKFSFLGTPLELDPYLEGAYDTEFTPTINADNDSLNPRQSELSGIFGLQIPTSPQLKTFKTGLALRRDFNVPNNLELGLILKFLHEWPISSQLIWSNDIDLKYYFPSPNDNETSLGLLSKWVSALKVPFTDNLALKFYADAYLFRGKLSTTSDLGASVILGVSLNYDRFWKPWYEF